jgi:hypothetical protein
MRTRHLVVAFVAALAVVGVASAATPKKKPFQVNAKTCATYASPAYVKSVTGLVGTPQKLPNGECHFVVGGQKDAFQVQIFVLKSPQQALALLNEGYNQDLAQANQEGMTCPTPADSAAPCPPPQKVSGIGNAAVLWNTGANGWTSGLDWFDTVRGSLIIAVQSSAPQAYVPPATEEAIARHLLAVIPK